MSGSEFWGWLSGSQGEYHWWSLGALKHFNLSKDFQVRGAGLRCFILNNNSMWCMINWMSIYCCIHKFLRFWKLSRNRLAGDEPPPSDSSILSWFWGSGKELPGGTLSAIRRRVGFLSVSGFWMKGLAVLIQPPGDASDKSRFWRFRGSGWSQVRGNSVINLREWSDVKISVECCEIFRFNRMQQCN